MKEIHHDSFDKENQMKTCRVAHVIYSRHVGGSEMVAANICSQLDQSIFSPLIFFMKKSTGEMPQFLDQMGIPHYGFEMGRFSTVYRTLKIAILLNKLDISILHVHHIPLLKQVLLGARLSGVKGIVFTEHAKYSITRSNALQKACRAAPRKVSYFTTVSEDLKSYFVSELGMQGDSIKVVHNGVDTNRFKPEVKGPSINELLPGFFSGKILISVGRLSEAKDQSTLLTAFRQVIERGFDVRLLIVGDGEMRKKLATQIEENGLTNHAFLLGSRPDVDLLLSQADCFVLSSRREGLPMVILEAMASGLPIISTAVGGIPEILRNEENGFLVPAEQPQKIAEKIEFILSHADKAKDMGRNNRQKVVENFSLKKTAQKYEEFYKNIMKALLKFQKKPFVS